MQPNLFDLTTTIQEELTARLSAVSKTGLLALTMPIINLYEKDGKTFFRGGLAGARFGRVFMLNSLDQEVLPEMDDVAKNELAAKILMDLCAKACAVMIFDLKEPEEVVATPLQEAREAAKVQPLALLGADGQPFHMVASNDPMLRGARKSRVPEWLKKKGGE